MLKQGRKFSGDKDLESGTLQERGISNYPPAKPGGLHVVQDTTLAYDWSQAGDTYEMKRAVE